MHTPRFTYLRRKNIEYHRGSPNWITDGNELIEKEYWVHFICISASIFKTIITFSILLILKPEAKKWYFIEIRTFVFFIIDKSILFPRVFWFLLHYMYELGSIQRNDNDKFICPLEFSMTKLVRFNGMKRSNNKRNGTRIQEVSFRD